MTFGSSLGLVLLVFCLLILWQIRQILLLLLMAILLAQILNLAVTWWQRHHLKRSYALIITLFGFFIGIIGMFVGIIPALVQQFRQLFSLLPQAIERLWGQVHSLEDYLDPSLASVLPDFKTLLAQLQPLINQIAGRGLSIFYGTFGIILSLLLIVALGLMILADPAAYYRCFLRLFPAFYRSRVRSILEQCDRDLKAWLKGIFCHMLIMTFGQLPGSIPDRHSPRFFPIYSRGISHLYPQPRASFKHDFTLFYRPSGSSLATLGGFTTLQQYLSVNSIFRPSFTAADFNSAVAQALTRFYPVGPVVFRLDFWLFRAISGGSPGAYRSYLAKGSFDRGYSRSLRQLGIKNPKLGIIGFKPRKWRDQNPPALPLG